MTTGLMRLEIRLCFLSKPKGEDGKLAGQQYYESICWKAINQSIGRAIRHQNDYASILLIDARYCNQPLASLKEKLPQWIGESLRQEQASSFDNKSITDHLVKVSAAGRPSCFLFRKNSSKLPCYFHSFMSPRRPSSQPEPEWEQPETS